MSLRTIASFAVAIFLGLLAVMLIRSYVGGKSAHSAAAVGTTPVVVANAAIARGMPLKPDVLKVVQFPNASVPQGSFEKVDDLVSANGVPKTALRDLVLNEPIVAAKVSGSGAAALSAQLSPGMRAVSVRSSDVSGVGGFVLPGDRVDVLLTRTLPGKDRSESVVQVLADNVRVLGVDQSTEAEKPTIAKAVTVEVSPEQAQKISLGQSVGEVSLSLRQVADQLPQTKQLMTTAELGGRPPVAHAARRRLVRPHVDQVQVTRGVEIAGYPVPR